MHTRTYLILFLLYLVPLLPLKAYGAEGAFSPYARELTQQALAKNLHESRKWKLLLHYKENLLSGSTSQADGKNFFISPNGKEDPKAELVATLRSFFKRTDELASGKEHPQCDFAARYKWLRQELSFDPLRLPEQPCERLQRWLTQIDPEKISIIFASYYMNNPASMFGHTLLRLNHRGTGPGKKLLSYGVNYAANPTTSNPILYALYGLVGLFQGQFTVFPYYVKVQEYSNWESRDLWEYELNLNDDQINNLLLHLWELGGTFFDYYYFQENCSYHMLTILEVANPDLHLTDEFFFSVIPADTLKAIARQPGLIRKVEYRPAILHQMKHKTEQMNDAEKDALHNMIEKPEAIKDPAFQSMDIPKKALVLDAYLDYLQYQVMQNEKEDPDHPFRIPHSVLIERSKLKHRRQDKEVTYFSTRVEDGHGSDRFRLGVGGNDEEVFYELAHRPTLHDLLAKDTGYGKDSQILFFDSKVRYYYESKKLRVDRYKLIDIISLVPYEPIFKKPSWRMNLGFDTLRDLNCGYCNSFKGNAGIGWSYKANLKSPYTLFALAEVDGETAGHLEDHYRVGGGAFGGVLLDLNKNWRIQLSAEYKRFPLGHDSEFHRFTFKQRVSLGQDLDLRLEYNRIEHRDEGTLALNIFF